MLADLLNTCPSVKESQGILFTNLLNWLLNLQCDLGNPNIYPNDQQTPLSKYDFIVVGAGSAGSVIASRLTEIPDWSVLLVEAGGDPTATSDVPGLFLFNDDLEWKYLAEFERGICEGYKGKQCMYKRGKGLGGSSLTNYLVYVRGNRHDFDHWEQLGNPGWSYKNVLKYFKKSEDMRMPEYIGSKYHRTGGYMGFEKGNDPQYNYLTDLIKNAAKEMGLPTSHDINGKSQTGFSEVPSYICNGTRCSTARAFLSPAKDRPNLHVMKNAHVTKLLIDEEKRAYGIEVKKNGKYYTIKSKKEIILSAGSIGSPQLLMLSGIGPKEHLEDLGINVVKDLRVGENLQDHYVFFGAVIAFDPFNISGNTAETAILDSYYEYVWKRSGMLSRMKTVMYMGFVDTTGTNNDWPDVQFYNFYFTKNDSTLNKFLDSFGFGPEYSNAKIRYTRQYDTLTLCPSILRPKSLGKLLLRNTDPFTYPKIYTGYIKAKEDVDTILRSIKFIEKFIQTDALKQRNAFLADIKYESCKDHKFGTDKYWICSMQQSGFMNYHSVGTCKMGPSSDRTAVVDAKLRVRGIKGLRVVDASVIPEMVSGNTNAAVIMVAEKASDIIKADLIKPKSDIKKSEIKQASLYKSGVPKIMNFKTYILAITLHCLSLLYF